MLRHVSNWWNRSGGGREVFTIASPMILSGVSATLLTFIDRIFLAWYSEDALAASFPAALLWWSALFFPLGTCTYAATFVSQYFGARQYQSIGPVVWQAIWVAVLATPIALSVIPLSNPVFEFSGHDAAIIPLELSYLKWLSWGTPALLISTAMASHFGGQGRTWTVLTVDIVAMLTNVILDYLLIFGGDFGRWGSIPAGGIAGAAIATTIAFWVKAAVYMIWMLRPSERDKFATDAWRIRPKLLKRLLFFAAPSGLQGFLEVSAFTVFILLLGRIGKTELAATNLAFNVSSVAFMPVFGLAAAAGVLVGQKMGASETLLAEQSAWTTMHIATAYMGVISFAYVVVPDLFLSGFFAREQLENADRIRQTAIVLLRYVAAYNLFDAMNLVFSGAVKGAGDTHFVMMISVVMAMVLGLSAWAGVGFLGFGLHACWLLVTVWVWILGVVYYLRFRQGAWKSMQVIEPEVDGLTDGQA